MAIIEQKQGKVCNILFPAFYVVRPIHSTKVEIVERESSK